MGNPPGLQGVQRCPLPLEEAICSGAKFEKANLNLLSLCMKSTLWLCKFYTALKKVLDTGTVTGQLKVSFDPYNQA